jgi:hypothetical protein
MTQAIATLGPVIAGAAGEVPRPATPGTRSAPPSVPETRAAARHNAETEGRYQVHIHAETMRIITEVVDMTTGDVIMYFPPGYRPDAQPAKSADKGTADK